MANRKLVIEVVGDASKLDKSFKQASTSTQKFGKSLDGVTTGAALSTRGLGGLSTALRSGGIALGLGLAAQNALEFGQAASDLNEQISKSRQVFGPASAAVEDWSKTTASALGISQEAALEAAGTFGNLFTTVRLAPQQSAEMSRALVKLAADLASFNNANPAEVLDALRSGLVGEAEPLRRFGVLLSEARVQQQAMADTGKTSATSLTAQEKTIARYELILRDTVKAQGDFARTSQGAANQQRILAAQVEDLKAKLGKLVLPVLTDTVKLLNIGAGAALDFADGLGKIGDVKIPPITIPLIPKILPGGGGGDGKGTSLGHILKRAAEIAPTPLSLPVLLHDLLTPNAKARAKDSGVDLGSAFGGGFVLGALEATEKGKKATPPSFGQPGFKVAKAPPVPLGPSVEQRNRFFDDMIGRKEDRVQDITSLQGQVKELDTIAGLIQKRIDATKDITRRLNLEDKLVSVRRQRKSVVAEIADQQAQAASDAAEKVRKAKERQQQLADELAKRIQIRQSTALGDVVPGVDNLRKQFQSLQKRLASSFDDTGTDVTLNSKLKSAFEGARKILNGELGKATSESRSRIQELFDTIRGEFDKEGKKGPLTATTKLNADRVLDGLGLSRDLERTLKARLSHFNSAGVALAGTDRTGPQNRDLVVNTTVNLDGQKVATNTTRHQQKSSRRNPVQTRGRNL